ncbi:hypothetical protein GOP47_0015311 [Adiantum capillus-veneris]|uniref:Uncharacterized protein n=1 Tax=Adiantum capillus-veneris TaxID=13818 RepID=A0A9D4ZD31_ADICA|nr:hypothetical protein GOP47_0015311 [Adiantum capillus-veneris]
MDARLLLQKRLLRRTGSTLCRRAWSSCSDSSSKTEELPPLDISHPVVTVWGANTNVGKTLISAGLSASLLSSGSSVSYLKPLQTGFPHDSDSRFVVSKVRHTLPHLSGEFLQRVLVSHSIRHVSPSVLAYGPYPPEHDLPPDQARSLIRKDNVYSCEKFVLEAHPDLGGAEWLIRAPNEAEEISTTSLSSTFEASTLWSWLHAVSPHIASAQEGLSVTDSTLLHEVARSISAFSKATTGLPSKVNELQRWNIIETAGGVASPGPTGTLQCDLYRPFRLPSVLVGDGKLGGISSTITAYESLINRGYDVDAIVLIDYHLGNGDRLRDYMGHRLPILVFPSIPEDLNDDLIGWFTKTASVFNQLQDHLKAAHRKKLTRLRDMQKKAGEYLWWPFTQHSLVSEDQITVIDARVGDSFMIFKNVNGSDLLMQQFDACASWWTQGPDLKLQLELAKQVGYATGRFGHVMLPENVYEPALLCAESLIKLIGKGWANKVYYSDNGSTAVEIAIKMALRKYLRDHQLLTKASQNRNTLNLKVLALRDSYHGDTLGAQEAQAPTAYTGFLQQPWYQGRGLFLDPPYIFMRNKKWHIDLPTSFMDSKHGAACVLNLSYQSRSDFFDEQREHSELATLYREFIRRSISSCKDTLTHLAALIIEPVIHGAAGMTLVDPLFQRILVKECKSQRIPVIFDEVFAGCWRLGVQSCAEYLGCTPDIGCYSKLLTGGVVPLAVTLASSAVFDSFKGDSKLLALLHGHSYSGHAIGCQAAVTSLQWLSDPKTNPNLVPSTNRLVEFWDPKLVAELSAHLEVQRVIALGTVFAFELRTNASESGYASMLSRSIVQALREKGIYNRPIGNVVYFMCGPTTPPSVCSRLLLQLSHQLDDFAAKKQAAAIHACA